MKLILIWVSGSGEDVVENNSYLELWQSSCLVQQNHLCNFERGHHGKYSCEVIWNLEQWFKRRCRSKTFLIWISDSPFVQRSVTIRAILVEGIMRNNSVKLF